MKKVFDYLLNFLDNWVDLITDVSYITGNLLLVWMKKYPWVVVHILFFHALIVWAIFFFGLIIVILVCDLIEWVIKIWKDWKNYWDYDITRKTPEFKLCNRSDPVFRYFCLFGKYGGPVMFIITVGLELGGLMATSVSTARNLKKPKGPEDSNNPDSPASASGVDVPKTSSSNPTPASGVDMPKTSLSSPTSNVDVPEISLSTDPIDRFLPHSGTFFQHELTSFLLMVITIITFFVLIVILIIVYVLVARGVVHYMGHKKISVEVVVFTLSTLALVVIGYPSISLLYQYRSQTRASLIVKVVGSQWYWNFEVSDIIEEEAVPIYIIPLDELEVGDYRFLEVDNRLVVPTGILVRFNVTSRDVIHSFALPTLGAKVDATAGLLCVVPVFTKKIGAHYGQCSEICGINHAFMPFCLEVTTIPSFFYWAYTLEDEWDPVVEVVTKEGK